MPLTSLSTASYLLPQSHFHPLLACSHLNQRRTAITDYLQNPFKSRRKRKILDPTSPEFLKLTEAKKAKQEKERTQAPKPGDLAPGSIFDTPTTAPQDEEVRIIRDPKNMAAALDPTPKARIRWQRKMVIREIRGRWRMSKTVKLARTERSHLCKSEFIKTSVKKLFPLANQIAGKPLSDAMVQMRFSKKKAAQDVLRHLEYARDQAIVMRGMGLGKVQAQAQAKTQQVEEKKVEDGQEAEKGQETEREEERLLVEDKKGKKRVVTDRTAMYVDEAWVGRGTYGFGADYRARGNVNRLRLPYTSKSIALAWQLACSSTHEY